MKKFSTTAEIKLPEKLMDQVIGQDKAIEIARKAAKQHRNVLLIGESGTGKTMIAQAMAELLPSTDLEDVLAYKNPNDENKPNIKVVKTYPTQQEAEKHGDGQGRQIVQREKMKNKMSVPKGGSALMPILILIIGALFIVSLTSFFSGNELIVFAALILGILIFSSMFLFVGGMRKAGGMLPGFFDSNEPKLIVDNTGLTHAPFVDGTGSRAGALFGDVRHDPLQSGGLGTPAHLRVESGAVHRANKGILFIDEIADLEPKSQQELLTAMQEKKYSITGQSELSSGAIVRTEPVPCDFLLVAAGNLPDIQKMHPAIRSRIRGYGYEIYMESTMPDTDANREKLVRFIAQEIKKDNRIPPFNYEACIEIVNEAKRRSGRKNRLSLILRDLGGVIRAAGDMAVEKGQKVVTREDVVAAFKLSKPIETQLAEQMISNIKDYKVFSNSGYAIGRVNGLAVMGTGIMLSGIITPIVSEVTPASSRAEGKLIATGKLGPIAREAVKNISAVIKRHMKMDFASYDIHVQFLQTYSGVEGDSASVSVAVSVISAMEGIPVDQSVAMTGSLDVRGNVLPVGGVTAKVLAAKEAEMKTVVIPESNKDDVNLDKRELGKIRIIHVKNIADVLQYALKKSTRRDSVIKELRHYLTTDYLEKGPLEINGNGEKSAKK